MKSNTYKALLNKNKKYSTFEIPEGISFTRTTKKIKAALHFSLYYSEDSGEAGMVCFENVEDAKIVMDFNKNRPDVKAVRMTLKIDNEWYKEDGVTLENPKELTIWDVKRELKITDVEISKMFGFANLGSYNTSSAKKRYESGIVELFKLMKK